jgi:tripartite-type tricarboxylate transporter receptor subunit TctC
VIHREHGANGGPVLPRRELGALLLALLALLGACRGAASPPARASSADGSAPSTDASFFAGKTLRIVVSFAPGAAYDRLARVLARHLPKHLPGNPTIIVDNMPGAGGVVAVNYLYNVAPKDGTVLASIPPELSLSQLVGESGVEYDVLKLNWVGSLQRAHVVCIARKDTGVRTLQDLLDRPSGELIMGANAPGSTSFDNAATLRALGGGLRIVSGYDGQAKVYLAMEQGEIQGTCSTWEGMRVSAARLVQGADALVSVFVQMSSERVPELADVPLVSEAARNADERALLRLLIEPENVQRPFALPPGVPPARVALLRQAFLDTTNDPAFQGEAERGGDELSPTPGGEVQTILAGVMDTPRAVVDKLKQIRSAP